MRNLDIMRPLSAAAILICLSANASRAGDFVPADLGTASVQSMGQASSQPSLDVPRQMIAFRQTATAMRLDGEDAARELTFYLSADQATTAGILRLSYTNAVSVMPDDAMLDVELNGKPLAAFPIRSPNGPATHDIPVSAKDLTVGWNQVRLRAKQHHRIDCSVQAAYELWTQVDPLVSGFLTSARPKDGDLASLLSVGRNGDGATEIRVIAGNDAPQTTLRDSLSLVQTLALVLGREDLSVTVGDVGGSGPGIDLYLGIGGAPAAAAARPRRAHCCTAWRFSSGRAKTVATSLPCAVRTRANFSRFYLPPSTAPCFRSSAQTSSP